MSFEKTIPLNEFITLQRGFDLPKGDRIEGEIPVIASTGVGGYHSEAKVEAPGVVIGRSGSIGGGQYITEDFWPLNTTLWVKDFKGHYPRYVYYLLRSIDFMNFNVGGAVPTLNRNHLSSVLIADIGYDNEKKIGEILGGLDDKIELNRQTNQTLEQIAQAIFKSWFVDFEPVKAKINAKKRWQALNQIIETSSPTCYAEEFETPDPNKTSLQEAMTQAAMVAISGKTEEQLKGLDEATLQQLKTTAALFPDGLVESELGEIPAGWSTQTVEDVIELAYGKSLKKTVRTDGEYPVYGSGGLTGMHNQCLVDGPGIVVGRKGTVGSLYWEDRSFYPIDTVFYVKCKSYMTLEFSYYLLQTLGLDGMNTDAAVPGLNRNNVYRIELPKYPDELVITFTSLVESFRNKIRFINEEMNTLESIRDSLLPKLLSGQFDNHQVA